MTWFEWIWPLAGVGGFCLGLYNLYLRFEDRAVKVRAEASLSLFARNARRSREEPREKIKTDFPEETKQLVKEGKLIPLPVLKITNTSVSQIGIEEVGFGNPSSGENLFPWKEPRYSLVPNEKERKLLPCYLKQKEQATVQSIQEDLSKNSEHLKRAEKGIYIKTTCGEVINVEISDFKKNLNAIKNL